MLRELSVDTMMQRLKRSPGCHWFVTKNCSRNDSSEVTSVICDRTTDESKAEQLSGLDDGDEDRDFPNSYVSKIKRSMFLIVSSFTFRIFGILLAFVDVSFIIIDLLVTDNTIYISLEYRSTSLSIALFFFMDVLLRVFVEGIQLYFSDIVNSIDAVIIVVTLLIDFTYISNDFEVFEDIPSLIIFLRSLRLVILMRIFHLTYQKRHLEKLTRRMVSGKKRRYKKDGFDLDLTYITGRIIAMSFPSSGQQSFYRNPIQEVVRFLDTKHRNHYQVYNLCSEKAYDPKHFHYRVHRLMVDDHNVPTLNEMVEFSKEVQKWMAQDDKNIVVIHCMGGKGRTGTMACASLIACGIFMTAEESLHYFGERRTDKATSNKFQGVETPSQTNKVCFRRQNWLEALSFKDNIHANSNDSILIHCVGKGNGSDLKVQIIMHQEVVFFSSASTNCRIVHDVERDRAIIHLCRCPPLHDDVKMRFLSAALLKDYDNCSFFFWFHTSFIRKNRLYLSRNKLDNPHKRKTWKIYRPEFAVEVYFDATDQVVADT